MRKIKVFSIFGTRPEAIKITPVLKELEKYPKEIESKVVVTAQHRELLDQVIDFFKIKKDYDLGIMLPEQTLTTMSVDILTKLSRIFEYEKPDLVLVQGDTPTAFSASIAAFYQKISIGHVEAGLRTYNKYDPFPEEMNRQLIDVLCDYYFVHTNGAKKNLMREGKPKERIFTTGNTVIDALLSAVDKERKFIDKSLDKVDFGRKVILVTTHRRENWGKPIEGIHKALKEIVISNKDAEIIFPVHPNPKVKQPAKKILGKHSRIHLVEPLIYADITNVLKKTYLVMTDSGGLQEEAPALGKPVLVLRRTTERMEGVVSGTAKLVGVDPKNIVKEASLLLKEKRAYQKMARATNPYGDGTAAKRIVKEIRKVVNA